MPLDLARSVGERVAVARRLRGMTQTQLAEAAAVSVSLLRKVERGSRPGTRTVMSAIARALELDEAELTGEPRLVSSRVAETIPAIRRALDCYDLPDDGPIQSLPELRAVIETATTRRLAAQYASLADILPALINDLTRAAHGYTGRDQRTAFGLLAIAYRATDAIADKFGYADLSARTIELLRWAAAHSGDPALVGVGAYVRAETFFADQHPTAGLRALDAASASLDPGGSRDALATYGSPHMRAAVVAACAGLTEAMESRLAEARHVARYLCDGVYCGTAFGPSSVRIHEMAAATELGDIRAVLRHAAGWRPAPTVPAERRSHFYIELARAQLWAGQRAETLASLQAARQVAPQHTRHNPVVHGTASALLRLHRHPSDTLLSFARWAGIARRKAPD